MEDEEEEERGRVTKKTRKQVMEIQIDKKNRGDERIECLEGSIEE